LIDGEDHNPKSTQKNKYYRCELSCSAQLLKMFDCMKNTLDTYRNQYHTITEIIYDC